MVAVVSRLLTPDSFRKRCSFPFIFVVTNAVVGNCPGRAHSPAFVAVGEIARPAGIPTRKPQSEQAWTGPRKLEGLARAYPHAGAASQAARGKTIGVGHVRRKRIGVRRIRRRIAKKRNQRQYRTAGHQGTDERSAGPIERRGRRRKGRGGRRQAAGFRLRVKTLMRGPCNLQPIACSLRRRE